MSDLDALLRRILDARPHPVDLDADEFDQLSAYLSALPPIHPGPPSVLGTFSAEMARRWPAATPDPAGTERLRRRHLEYVRRVNERRLAAPSLVAEAPPADPPPNREAMASEGRIPSVAQLRDVVAGLARLLHRTGPNAPPGYGEPGRGESWARDHQRQIIKFACDLRQATLAVIDPDAGFTLRVHGWPANVSPALCRAVEATDSLIHRWGLHLTSSGSFVWGDGTDLVRLSFAVEGLDSEAPPVRVPYPLVVEPDEYRALRWAFRELDEAVRDTGGRPNPLADRPPALVAEGPTDPSPARDDGREPPMPDDALADRIRHAKPRAKLQAALVDAMRNRKAASYAAIAHDVYGDDSTGGDAIEQLVKRTNNTLVDLLSPIRFRCGGEYVFKDISPE
ncbi:hypothetical protein BH23PLA1_BH23PLA1_27120 [soil metagenome]